MEKVVFEKIIQYLHFLHVVCLFSSAGRLKGLLANVTPTAAGFLPAIVCFFVGERLRVV